tara:strand:- start:562 stop:1353 length:792 start_codon:yes stop_codon:yes gene_type:complete
MLFDASNKSTADSDREDTLRYLSGQKADLEYPKGITMPGQGGKFDPSGNVMHHPGNTFVCHVDQKSDFFVSLCTLQDGLKKSPLAGNYTFLPQNSFHMTIFCGISGSPLGVDGWPREISSSANLDEITQEFDTQVSAWEQSNKICMQPLGMSMPGTVRMVPATDMDARTLREVRYQLQDLTGLYRKDIDTYDFHISLGYLKQWFNDSEANTAMRYADRLFHNHLHSYKNVEFGPIEFCIFQNMHHFKIITVLGNAGHLTKHAV